MSPSPFRSRLFTPLFSVFVAYTFMALDAIASQIEEPFGTDDNDLALDALSAFIEDAARDMLAQPSLTKVMPKDDYLLS